MITAPVTEAGVAPFAVSAIPGRVTAAACDALAPREAVSCSWPLTLPPNGDGDGGATGDVGTEALAGICAAAGAAAGRTSSPGSGRADDGLGGATTAAAPGVVGRGRRCTPSATGSAPWPAASVVCEAGEPEVLAFDALTGASATGDPAFGVVGVERTSRAGAVASDGPRVTDASSDETMPCGSDTAARREPATVRLAATICRGAAGIGLAEVVAFDVDAVDVDAVGVAPLVNAGTAERAGDALVDETLGADVDDGVDSGRDSATGRGADIGVRSESDLDDVVPRAA